MSISTIKRFLALESIGGVLLFVMAILAMLWANSSGADSYEQFRNLSLFTINDGLMTLFFLLVGLELKRECLDGQLKTMSQVLLPAIAAIGGMLVPVFIYFLINKGDAGTLQGWAIPVATDIAFALGVLSLFGPRIPQGLKIFLLALAIYDDLGAILIIAIFYGHDIAWFWLGQALLACLILFIMHLKKFKPLWVYLGMMAWLWWCFLHAGFHPTLAGVVVAFCLPFSVNNAASPLLTLEKNLHPWVIYGILPLFALVNAGVNLQHVNVEMLTSGIVLGIVAGLFFGKQIGVMSFTWLFIHNKGAKLPAETSWLMLYGVAILCGIGFTMSLFLGTLSFTNESIYLTEVRLGVLLASLLSGFFGALVIVIALARKRSSIV